ncbi:MAG: zinc-ribbon domain-containing protein [Clostridia bacterium]|nr:zinc-ribbon domain-containing protein [Clostridia bacterium]
MKICPNCQAQLDDNAGFCTNCGFNFAAQQQQQYQQQPYAAPAPVVDPYDHTAEFDPKDISDNKVYAMLVYLLGAVGIIIALLASHDSAYVRFHLRQALKFIVVETLTAIVSAALVWTFIVPIAGGIFMAILGVLQIIIFFQICGGKAKEPAIIRSLGFLK